MNSNLAPARAILDRLIGFDTVSAKSNLALIEWVRGYLKDLGVESHLTPNPEGTKANLYATIGPARAGGVVLSGHTDVVPVEGQVWATDPFAAVEKAGKLYGRGTSDMKGFIACALAMAPHFLAAPLKTPIHYALSFDEEVGCLGVPHLLAKLERDLPKPRIAVIGEPTSMQVITGHKGLVAWRATLTGVEAHSSRIEEAVSAIFAASRFVEFVASLAALHRQGAHDHHFDPPFATFNIGRIEGGQAINIVPGRCVVEGEFRPLPATDVAALTARMRHFVEAELRPALKAKNPAADATFEILAGGPAFAPEIELPAEILARRLTGANRSGTVAYGTEAGHFQRAGISSVVCGPGSIEQAHKPDEWIELDQLSQCLAFLGKLKEWAAGNPEW